MTDKHCITEQAVWVQNIGESITAITGYDIGTKHYWMILAICKAHVRHLRLGYIAAKDIAQCGVATYSFLTQFMRYGDPQLSDEQIVDMLTAYLRDNPETAFITNARITDPKGVRRYLYDSIFSLYPKLPSREALTDLATYKSLNDCYHYGIYADILSQLSQGRERVPITGSIPPSVRLQLRFMELFAMGHRDDVLACCIMHAWETLGRRILKSCGGAKTIEEAYNYLIQRNEEPIL